MAETNWGDTVIMVVFFKWAIFKGTLSIDCLNSTVSKFKKGLRGSTRLKDLWEK